MNTVSSEKQRFESYVRSSGLKFTCQRELVLEAFLQIEEHVSVDDLYQMIRRDYRNVGYATVHRTMKLICDSGLAREVVFDDGVSRYEHSHHSHHHHLVCTECRKIIEFESPEMERGEQKILKEYGFAMQFHRCELFGLCRDCQSRKCTVSNNGGRG